MPDEFDAHRFAAMLVAAHQNHVPLSDQQIGGGPTTLDEIDIIHDVVIQAIGPAGGFKTAWPDGGKPQIMAPIPVRNVRPSPARFEAGEMRLYGIEIEIAFRIDRDLPDPSDADFEDQLRQAVSVVPAIEMVDSRLADRDGASDLTRLADNQSGFGLVVGQPVADWQALNITTPSVSFTVNGRQTGPTEGLVPGGQSAFDVLKGFVVNVGECCGGLKVGHYVTCGAVTGLHWTEPGVAVEGSIAGIGDVAVTIGD